MLLPTAGQPHRSVSLVRRHGSPGDGSGTTRSSFTSTSRRARWAAGCQISSNGPTISPPVRLHAPATTVAARLAPAAGLLEPVGEQTCVLSTGGDSLYELAAFLGSLEVGFQVLDPPELRDLLRRLADRFTAATA